MQALVASADFQPESLCPVAVVIVRGGHGILAGTYYSSTLCGVRARPGGHTCNRLGWLSAQSAMSHPPLAPPPLPPRRALLKQGHCCTNTHNRLASRTEDSIAAGRTK